MSEDGWNGKIGKFEASNLQDCLEFRSPVGIEDSNKELMQLKETVWKTGCR